MTIPLTWPGVVVGAVIESELASLLPAAIWPVVPLAAVSPPEKPTTRTVRASEKPSAGLALETTRAWVAGSPGCR